MGRHHRPEILDRISFGLVCLLAIATQWNGVRVGSLALEDVLMGLAFGAVVFDMLAYRRWISLPSPIVVAACGLAVVGFLAALFPPAPTLTSNPVVQQAAAVQQIAVKSRSNLGSLAKFEAAVLLLPFMIAVVATSRARALRIAELWALGAIISSLVATTDMIGVTHISQAIGGLPYAASRQSGLTLQSNHLALESVLVLPFVGMWLTRTRFWRVAAVIGIALLVLGIYASGSRAGEALSPVALVFVFLVAPQLRPRFVAFSPLLALLGILAVLTASGVLNTVALHARLTSTASGVVASDVQRFQLRGYSVRAFNARPLTGVGYTVIDDAHDIYLQLLAAGGVVALGSFFVLIVGMFGVTRRSLRSVDRLYAAALGAALLVWMLNGLVGNQVTDRYLYVPVGVLVVLASLPMTGAVRVRRQPTDARRDATSLPPGIPALQR